MVAKLTLSTNERKKKGESGQIHLKAIGKGKLRIFQGFECRYNELMSWLPIIKWFTINSCQVHSAENSKTILIITKNCAKICNDEN